MGHTSKLDKIIFDEFHENLDNLAIEANIILEGYGEKSLSYWDELGEIEEIPEGEIPASSVRCLRQLWIRVAVFELETGTRPASHALLQRVP